jgi:hypothetical protein
MRNVVIINGTGVDEANIMRTKLYTRDTAEYYDRRGVLEELVEGQVEFALDEELREQILKGKRRRRLKNISIKLDEAQIIALRKIATLKSTPYQTLIREWLAAGIRKELRISAR